jgi:DNA ligase-1
LPPREYSFDQTLSAVIREQPISNHLRFAVFDTIPAEPLRFKERWLLIDGYGVETRYICTIPEFEKSMEDFTRAGHEGIIVRDPDGWYTAGKSNALLKYKTFQDAEFRVVDVIEATGKDRGTAVFVCATAAGVTFHVRPAGDFEERSIQFEERESTIGRMYTVRFQELTNRGIPRFPTGVAFRPTRRETTQV